MKSLVATSVLTIVLMAFCCGLYAQETQQDAKAWAKLNATWQPVVMKLSGSDFPKAQMEAISLTLKDGKYEMKSTAGMDQTGKITLGTVAEGKPAPMDIEFKDEDDKTKVIKAIYKFDNDNLVVCYRLEGDRPESFESSQENQNLYIEYKKKK